MFRLAISYCYSYVCTKQELAKSGTPGDKFGQVTVEFLIVLKNLFKKVVKKKKKKKKKINWPEQQLVHIAKYYTLWR